MKFVIPILRLKLVRQEWLVCCVIYESSGGGGP
jgi:hypothetical protein